MRGRIAVAVIAAASLVAAPAPGLLHAQPAPAAPAASPRPLDLDARKRDAKAKFLQGREALNRGEYATALVLLRTSQDLYPSPGTLLNLALCEERLGMLGSAYAHFQEVGRLLAPGDDRLSIAKHGLASLEQRVPRLRIDLAKGAPEGTTIARGGALVPASDLGKDLLVDPGKHVIVASAPGRPDRSYEASLVEGGRVTLSVEPGPPPEPPKPDPAPPAVDPARAPVAPTAPVPVPRAPVEPPPRPAEPDDTTSGMRTAAYVVGGVGVAGISVGAVTGILAFVRKGEVDDACGPKFCTQEGLDAEASGKTMAAVSTVAFAVGFAGVGVGAVLLLTSGRGGGGKTTTSIAPVGLPGGAGVSARVRF